MNEQWKPPQTFPNDQGEDVGGVCSGSIPLGRPVKKNLKLFFPSGFDTTRTIQTRPDTDPITYHPNCLRLGRVLLIHERKVVL